MYETNLRRLLVIGEPLFLRRHRPLIDELAARVTDVDVHAVAPQGVERAFASRLLQPLRKSWARLQTMVPLAASIAVARDSAAKRPSSFVAKSEEARRAILERRPPPDAVLQIFSLFSARSEDLRPPHVTFLDYTMALAQRQWPAWAAFADEQERQAWLALERDTYQGAAHIFCTSEAVRESLIRDYGVACARTTVVGGSGDFIEPYTGERTYAGRNLIFNGTDFKRKGGDLAIAAFARVREAIPDATLHVVGACSAPRQPRVKVLGNVPREELDRLLLQSDVVLAPSRCDPFPGFVIEAMNFGVVPVVSAADGLPEIVRHGENGLVVPNPTAEELSGHTLRLLTDAGLRRRFSQASRLRVAETLLWSHVAERIVSVLRPRDPVVREEPRLQLIALA
jgi:glycosyltransferase involved in cell wall biosynthesis